MTTEKPQLANCGAPDLKSNSFAGSATLCISGPYSLLQSEVLD
eukprot:CAMPEP_0172709124 /NCGR_PEP_ID=MMETSP1074-20121228/53443_1 /TAXON_ID=2916 /ORGANISM="Ceratium fusus, Strain PA161109" /LENGTH=42 /DNA_ID= /DNA_START= /DNA_END= /DNA_ORIENTATION=